MEHRWRRRRYTNGRAPLELSKRAWTLAAAGTLLIVIASAARSATQVRSMAIVGRGGQMAGLGGVLRGIPGAIGSTCGLRICSHDAGAARPRDHTQTGRSHYSPIHRRQNAS